jgi:hypothetical protein
MHEFVSATSARNVAKRSDPRVTKLVTSIEFSSFGIASPVE